MVVGMILGMVGSLAVVNRLGRHLLHLGVLLIAAGAAPLALVLTGAHTASTGISSLDSSWSAPAPAPASGSSSDSS